MKNLYRPDIDGLRGIAVLLVVFYHFKFAVFGKELFKGGFLGVDVFFVISGYLITKIILTSLENNNFSFFSFYIRRVRRILPMFLVILIFTFTICYFLFLTNQFSDFSYSSLSSLFFYSNYYFYNFNEGYVGNSGIDKPLLHTWSLSIEVQFYIFFPIIILLIYKYLKKYLFEILLFSFFVSLILADFFSRLDSLLTFYILPTRAWELLAGSLCFFYEKNKNFNKSNFFSYSLPIVGLFLILYSVVFFKDSMRLPSFYSIPTVLGASLIIIFNIKEGFIKKILCTRILVGLGLVSYSLYLWHYPLASYYRTFNNTLFNFTGSIFLILISILLSIFSYYFIEKPFRNKKFIINKYLILLLSFFSFFIVLINILVIKNNGLPDRLPIYLQKDISLSKPLWDQLKQNKIICANSLSCIFNSNGKSGKVIILGDSQSSLLAYNLKDRLIDKDFIFYVLTQNGCLYVKDFQRLYRDNNEIFPFCNFAIQKKISDILINNPNSIVIYSATGLVSYKKEKWISINSQTNILNGVENTILDLIKLGNKVIILYPLPKPEVSVAQQLFYSFLFKKKNPEIYLPFDSFKKESYEVNNFLDSIIHKDIFRIYPSKIFCNEKLNKCTTYDEKNIYYSDDVHLSFKGSQLVNDLIIKDILKINNIK